LLIANKAVAHCAGACLCHKTSLWDVFHNRANCRTLLFYLEF
jgi:hypothetical protein